MRVTFGNQQLAGFGGDSVSGFRRSGRKVVELQEAVRAAFATPRDRGNVVNEVAFQVWKEYASVGAAERAIATEFADVEALEGAEARKLYFEPEDGGAAFWLNKAVMNPVQIRQVGVTLIFSFSFVGGAFTFDPPA